MAEKPVRIGVVAPANTLPAESAARVQAIVAERYAGRIELVVHPQCFLSWRHFAGKDEERAAAFVACANDPTLDAIWFARGGYGSNRFALGLEKHLTEAARAKTYLGYSDGGFVLASLYKHAIGRAVHGPVLNDIARKGGEAAVVRALDFLLGGREGIEPSVSAGVKHAAFNLTVLSNLLGTPLEPNLSDHVLMIEDIDEEMYRIDRTMFHVSSSAMFKHLKGVRLGRVSMVPENDPPFVANEEEVVRFWCERAGVAYLGRADIGHDVDNRIVPFGLTD